MIARHSHEQSDQGEGVEVVANAECEDPEHGKGQFTEKRIHLSRYAIIMKNIFYLNIHIYIFYVFINIYFLNLSRLPYWVQSLIPKIFYVTEKAWNFYPFTITGNYSIGFIYFYVIYSPRHTSFRDRPNFPKFFLKRCRPLSMYFFS